MKIYKTKNGIVIEKEGQFFTLEAQSWDAFINDDRLFDKLQTITTSQTPEESTLLNGVLAPIGSQELWACGVTYLRSKIGRQEE
ncbi:MAG TPA: 2-hydroxyhepta-2,4-diene-1,7-dioate isomerase, partial [Flavisolibacter sp.]|nr:2-hydroxyhepta-2,4-diene-1,7-dioate isomerase [Flavisolibacter sp.]